QHRSTPNFPTRLSSDLRAAKTVSERHINCLQTSKQSIDRAAFIAWLERSRRPVLAFCARPAGLLVANRIGPMSSIRERNKELILDRKSTRLNSSHVKNS